MIVSVGTLVSTIDPDVLQRQGGNFNMQSGSRATRIPVNTESNSFLGEICAPFGESDTFRRPLQRASCCVLVAGAAPWPIRRPAQRRERRRAPPRAMRKSH